MQILANSDSCLKPYKFVIIGHDRAGALLCRMIVPNGVLVHY